MALNQLIALRLHTFIFVGDIAGNVYINDVNDRHNSYAANRKFLIMTNFSNLL